MRARSSPEWRLVDAIEGLLLPRINARDPNPLTLYTQLMCVGGEWLEFLLSNSDQSAAPELAASAKALIRREGFIFLEGIGPFFPKVNVNDKPHELARMRARYEVGFAICVAPIRGALAEGVSLNSYAERLRTAKAERDAKLGRHR